MKILITGGTGFVGRTIAKKLIDGNDITLLTKRMSNAGYLQNIIDKVTVIQKDIQDISEDDVRDMDCIYHCASTVDNYNLVDGKPFLDAEVNVIGTSKLLEVCRQANPKVNIIYVSTFFVQGMPIENPVDVDQKPEPLGLYGASKLCAEHYCKTYNRVFGMNVKIARLTNVFGIGDQYFNNKKSAFSRMIYLAADEKDPIKLYDNGKVRRDYIYIDDVADALITIANKGRNNKIYYVGRGEGVKLRELVDMIIDVGKDAKVDVKVDVIAPPTFHNQVGINDFWCDNSELKKLGWEPKISLKEGIRKTFEYFRIVIMNQG